MTNNELEGMTSSFPRDAATSTRDARALPGCCSGACSKAEANNEHIGATGFEPATSWSQTTRSTKLSYAPRECVMVITCSARAHVKSKATCRRGDRSTKLSYAPMENGR